MSGGTYLPATQSCSTPVATLSVGVEARCMEGGEARCIEGGEARCTEGEEAR
jgi:hypothetical protein